MSDLRSVEAEQFSGIKTGNLNLLGDQIASLSFDVHPGNAPDQLATIPALTELIQIIAHKRFAQGKTGSYRQLITTNPNYVATLDFAAKTSIKSPLEIPTDDLQRRIREGEEIPV